MTASSEPQTKTPDWQKRYFDSLDKLERERQQFSAMEAMLKRLIGRLGSAAQGQSGQLDAQIKALQTALKREAGVDELEKVTAALTDAIARLDTPVAPQSVAPPVASAPAASDTKPQPVPQASPIGDAQVCAAFSALLAELRHDPTLTLQADELDSRLASTLPTAQLPQLVCSITALVTQRVRNVERSKQEVEDLLRQMVGSLDDISRFVSDQSHDQNQSMVSRETLNTQLVGEMKAMGDSVESAVDLQEIRLQVRGRLDSIGQHLKEFRTREAARLDEVRSRNDQMQTRVAQLEAETSKLQHRLDDEQRLSSIDALTNIPNRLAYDRRIEEELQRWKRFGQPTCIAVWDIDRFKGVNDAHGHRAGDRVLRAVADTLASRLRRTDFLARFGGEEFVMILCGTAVDAVLPLIDQMRIAISTLKFHIQGTPVPAITVSIGVTAFVANDTAEAAFDRADKALYRAKESGRNRCVRG